LNGVLGQIGPANDAVPKHEKALLASVLQIRRMVAVGYMVEQVQALKQMLDVQ
jgi:hypothetical protein